ncbi:MAG: Zn-ribbon domain-containing OB-fold protein [Candidatus Thermoplasmatota archaeon]|nr:Zn-ribbon domain-containing OB-fold protein [Candidatus Thermoplasmatota archaeon]
MAIPRFWREIQSRYNLVGTRCGNCGTLDFPPRDVCPKCGRKSVGKMEKVPLSDSGTVVSYTTIHHAPKGFDGTKPYLLAIVELKDGARLTSQIIDCDPADIAIGMPVEATFRKLGQDGASGIIYYGYKFRPSLPATEET